MGRPTKRTPELTAQLADAMALGLTDDQAAALVGIASSTLSEWLKIEEFSDAVKGAQARRLYLRLLRVERGETGWQGAAWTLERLLPKQYARPEVLIQNNVMAAANANAQGANVLTDERIAEIQRLRRGALLAQEAGVVIDAERLAIIQAAEETAREFGQNQ